MTLGLSLSRRRIPHVQQLEMADCGPACLTMVLGYYGHHVSLDEVRDRVTADWRTERRRERSADALATLVAAYGVDDSEDL